ncbi:transglutaminase-like domain-containing protein [Blastopirellula marina]|uniref:Transglutaminase-like domain-containing protein n=1 Tax=Blastopirellula marina TaxID=124 RepID=A0A2S8G0S5_9BACT|nr:transglutaminase-like domain-containing protein [Blastopirellula marina]PQO38036.1 hypothetical protein C5Y98_08090 [Blastopirellula marina]PTL44692.1 transglutaminase domain-containing protein [Blastopirellula marina]
MVPDNFTKKLHLAMALSAVLGVQLAVNHGLIGPWWQWLEIGTVVLSAWGCSRFWTTTQPLKDVRVTGLLLAVVAGHFIVEQVLYHFSPRSGYLFEGQVALAMRNVMLAALPFRTERRIVNMTTLLSLALMATSVFMSVDWSITICGIVYAVLGVSWLVASHWDRIAGRFPEGTRSEIPRGAVGSAFALAVLLVALAVYLVGTEHATRALAGFMPSSGGNRSSDVRSQAGVGDGEDLVRGTKDAMSFGPTESEIFLESQMPSLFDAFNDMYDAPVRKPKKQNKAISLPPSSLEHRHSRIATSKSKGKDFSLLRRNEARRQKNLDDKKSPAMFYVKGRVPLHLRTTIYDRFDGVRLQTATEHGEPPIRLVNEDGVPWYEVSCFLPKQHLHSVEEHLLKFINLKTERVPAPPRLSRFHIKDVAREDMFDLAEDGHPRITVEFIPQLTVMRVQSLMPYASMYQNEEIEKQLRASLEIPDESSSFPKIRELAQEWTRGVRPGWGQIDAIQEHLKAEYAHTATSGLDEETEFPVEAFLLETKQGPDYLFATAASLLLRELGYTSRVVSGFYADPKHYDVGTWQTAVHKDDVHFWVEVSWDGNVWHPIEPTPGYALLAPPLTSWQKFEATCLAAWNWCVEHKISIGIVATCLILFAIFYARLADQLFWWINRLPWLGSERNRVLWTARLIEWRSRIWGRRRPSGYSIGRWLQSHCKSPHDASTSQQFVLALNWALYGSTSTCPFSRWQLDHLRRDAFSVLIRSPRPKSPQKESS